MREHSVLIDAEACICCGLCAADCPTNIIAFTCNTAVIQGKNCIYCGHCAAVCPKAAIVLTGFDEEPEELAQKTILDPQTLLAALKSRRSIRQFKRRAIEPEILAQIIEAGRISPTAKNAQKVSYIVLEDERAKCEKIAIGFLRMLQVLLYPFSSWIRSIKLDDDFLFKKAPLVIVVLANTTIDGVLAASSMTLMAEAHGLGVLYNGYFTFAAAYSRKLRKALSLKGETVAATLVLGYPTIKYRRTVQRETAVVRYL